MATLRVRRATPPRLGESGAWISGNEEPDAIMEILGPIPRPVRFGYYSLIPGSNQGKDITKGR